MLFRAAAIAAILALPLLSGGCASGPQARPGAAAPPAFARGMVSAADPRAAGAGAEILRAGGSATDAAIATMLALSVVEPQSSGIGGGGFLVTSDAAGHVTTLDGRETAPAAAHERWFWADGKAMSFAQQVPGGSSVGVPGNIALAARAHAVHGRIAWPKLFGPAIRLARDGFEITPRMREFLVGSTTAGYTAAGRALFYGADGQPKAVGARVTNPELAVTLESIAKSGSRWFYEGVNARAIAGAVAGAARNPAPLTAADVAGYAARPRDPVCASYRRYRVCGMGPPSSGATTVLATLGQLERFDLGALGKDSPVFWHLFAESMRLAYADRAKYLADSDFVSVPVDGLVDPAYLARRSALIDPARSMANVAAGTPPGAEAMQRAELAAEVERGTSHFVAVDRRGNAASYTSTIESSFGSGLMVGGYYLNNELTDFDEEPEKDGIKAANRVEGGKRPRSSMAPTLVFAPDGRLRLVIGAAGGTTIPAQVAKAIIGVIDFRLSAQEAIALPQLLAIFGDTLYVEQGTALEAMIPSLNALGHARVMAGRPPAKANAVEVVDGRLAGAADPRSEGRAVSE